MLSLVRAARLGAIIAPGFRAMGAASTLPVSDVPPLSNEDFQYPFELAARDGVEYDPAYPGTAVARLRSVLKRVHELGNLDGPWQEVRRQLLSAGGLKEDYSTSHAFNDDNHCDLTTMVGSVSHNSNADGAVAMISRSNQLGPHIARASLPEHGPGGSWSTCTNGAHMTPPSDVAHVQFASRIAFKLVWVPPDFEVFVLVDDEGRELKRGRPTGSLPSLRARKGNYALVKGGKYATVADALSADAATDKLKVCTESSANCLAAGG
eukprot:TRINITY_DN94273_c0_g1_i1.p1 TRINITY_DN94273_c0_g1~~TRINITY_DN94273_c0_g1_i1.p1  ORF type:complete len:265 (+),score=45.19 TRINITY_DN94273_c0_g1_i1:23-817(+)